MKIAHLLYEARITPKQEALRAIFTKDNIVRESILSVDDAYALLKSVLTKHGLQSGVHDFRGTPALRASLAGTKMGRAIYHPNENVWKYDVLSGQGHKVFPTKTGSEQDVLRDFLLHRKGKSTLKEAEPAKNKPLIWQIVAQQIQKRIRVSIDAIILQPTALRPNNHIHVVGEISRIDGNTIHVYADRHFYSFTIRSDDDERYTLEKDKHSSFYWVKDVHE
jgi:hypothetical protein